MRWENGILVVGMDMVSVRMGILVGGMGIIAVEFGFFNKLCQVGKLTYV